MRRALLRRQHILKLHMTEDKKALQNKTPPPAEGRRVRGLWGKSHQIILALAGNCHVESEQRDKRESNCLGKSLLDTVEASSE